MHMRPTEQRILLGRPDCSGDMSLSYMSCNVTLLAVHRQSTCLGRCRGGRRMHSF